MAPFARTIYACIPCRLQAMQSMSCELEAKSLALADAEMRFTELEALMQRIIGRTSALHNPGFY